MWQEWHSGTSSLGHKKLCSFYRAFLGHSLGAVGHHGGSPAPWGVHTPSAAGSSPSVCPATAADMWVKPFESFRTAHLSAEYHPVTSVNTASCKRVTRLSCGKVPDPQSHEIECCFNPLSSGAISFAAIDKWRPGPPGLCWAFALLRSLYSAPLIRINTGSFDLTSNCLDYISEPCRNHWC